MRTPAVTRSLILILLLAAAGPALAQPEAGGADREWRFIEKLRADGMQDLALRQLEAFARDYPADPRAPGALLEAARGEAALGRPLKAVELCEDLLRRFPSATEAPAGALLRADQIADQGRSEDAATAYRNLLSAYPASAEVPAARLGLGEALMSLERSDEARRLFTGLVGGASPAPVSARARYDLGVLDLDAGADSLAIARFESIHRLHPQEPIGAFGLVRAAELLAEREATDAAAERYETVIARYDNAVLKARARLGLAALVEEEDPDRAVDLYRAVLEEGAAREDLKRAYLGLGRAALGAGDTSLAGSISTAFLERFGDEPEADLARLTRARALLDDEPELGRQALEELTRSADPDVAWDAALILAARARAEGDLDRAELRWRQAEVQAGTDARRGRALFEQSRLAAEQGRDELAADLGELLAATAEADSQAARGLAMAARSRARSGELGAAIALAQSCAERYPLEEASAQARRDLAIWSRMSVADPEKAAEELARVALETDLDARERAMRVGRIQRDLLGDHGAATRSFDRARGAADDPGAVSAAQLELARTHQLAALVAGLDGNERAARDRLRDAREALVSVASRGGTGALQNRGRIELYGIDLATAARPDAPWLFDPRTMPLLGAVGPAEDVDLSSERIQDTRRRIAEAIEGSEGDQRAWLCWRAAELSGGDLEARLRLVDEGRDAARDEGLEASLLHTRGQLLLQAERPADAARDLASVVAGSPHAEVGLAARYALAEAQRQLKRYEQAGDLYREFAAAFPGTRRGQRALLLSGDCALFAGRPDDAVRAYRDLLDRYPDSRYRDDALYRLGTALERAGKLEAARAPLWTLVDGDDRSGYQGRALARLGRIELAAGQDSLAVEVFSRLIRVDPGRAAEEDAWVVLAETELRRGQAEQALGWARAVSPESPGLARARALEIEALAALGRTGEAAQRLEEFSLSHPDEPELVASARVQLGEALAERGQDASAAEAFARARGESSDPETRARAAYGEAMVATRAQRWAEARAGFERARDLAPDSDWAAEALFKLGQLYLRASENAAARSAFSTLSRRFPEHPKAPDAMRAEAQVWRQEGRYDEAIKVYHALLEQYPEVDGAEQVLSSIAYCHHEMGQHEIAISAYQRVMPLLEEEDQAYAQFWIADSMDQLGRHEEAAAAFLRIPYLYPEMGQLGVTAQLKAGEAWEHQGDAEAARQIYERVVQAHGPDSQWGAEANRRLSRLAGAGG